MQFLRTRRSRSARIRNTRRNQLRRANIAEKLECRELLVGQVTALVKGDNLFLRGDNSANQVEVAFHDGNVTVRPKNGTRINGQRGAFIAFENTDTVPGSIFANMRQGDDTLILTSELRVTRDVKMNGREGADTLGLDNVVVRDDLFFIGGSGDDRVSIENSRVVDNTNLKMSLDNDLVRIVSADLRGKLTVRGGLQDDSVVMDDVTVRGKTRLRMNRGDDIVDLQNVRTDTLLRVETYAGIDSVVIDDSTIRGKARFNLGAGDDNLILGDADGSDATPSSGNIFQRSFKAVGRAGIDNIRIDVDNTFRSRRLEGQFEGDAPGDNTGGAIADADTLGDDVTSLIGSFGTGDRALTATVDTSVDTVGQVGTGDTETFTTTDETITITGRASNNAALEIDTNGDGDYSDATVTADALGDYSIDVPLAVGSQTVDIRNADETEENQQLNIDRIDGPIIRMTTAQGDIDVQLFETEFPVTTANFQSYFDRYGDNMFIHRSPDDFVIQGGGFTIDGTTVSEVPEFDSIPNEFAAGDRSNVPGTISMALLGGDVDSGNSQWFINIGDNSASLDAVPHTVFGSLIGGANGPSMEVARAINALDIFNISSVTGNTALAETPLVDYDSSVTLTGSVSVADGDTTVNGIGTLFTSQVDAGDFITIGTDTFTVDSIVSDIELTITNAANDDFTAETATIEPIPDATNYVVFSEIRELTDGLNDL